jgi:hypothetical protein
MSIDDFYDSYEEYFYATHPDLSSPDVRENGLENCTKIYCADALHVREEETPICDDIVLNNIIKVFNNLKKR